LTEDADKSKNESTADANMLIEFVRKPKTNFMHIRKVDTITERRAARSFLFLLELLSNGKSKTCC
jgi:hypothetical protein